MPERLRIFLGEDSEERLWRNITRRLEDPLKPRANSGRIRINPALLIVAFAVVVGVSIFICFSYGLQ